MFVDVVRVFLIYQLCNRSLGYVNICEQAKDMEANKKYRGIVSYLECVSIGIRVCLGMVRVILINQSVTDHLRWFCGFYI